MTSEPVKKADANLWAAYGNKLKDSFAQGALGPGDRFYVAPLSYAGIAAGHNINDAIKNQGVYSVGDAMLEINSPVFAPTQYSYFQRALQYTTSVDLRADHNEGARLRYQNAQDAAKQAQKDYNEVDGEAYAAYQKAFERGTTKDTYFEWTGQYYPQLAVAQNALDAAAAALSQATAEMEGPNAPLLSQYINGMNAAKNTVSLKQYNMLCSPAAANQIRGQSGTGNLPESFNRPSYTIATQYPANVDNWVATYPQYVKNPSKISFTASEASKAKWSDLGFEEKSVTVTGSYCWFFSATYTENNKTITKNISAEEAGSDLEITLTATGLGTYPIQRGAWNPSQLWGMPLLDNADKSLLLPSAYVNQALLAYGVGLSIKMSSNFSEEISRYLEKASSSKGSARIFGFNIGLGGDAKVQNTSTVTFDQVKKASSGSVINIPPSDNGYPTLLAVFGKDLPLPTKQQ